MTSTQTSPDLTRQQGSSISGLPQDSSIQPAPTFHARWQANSDSVSASSPTDSLFPFGRHENAGFLLLETQCDSGDESVIWCSLEFDDVYMPANKDGLAA